MKTKASYLYKRANQIRLMFFLVFARLYNLKKQKQSEIYSISRIINTVVLYEKKKLTYPNDCPRCNNILAFANLKLRSLKS